MAADRAKDERYHHHPQEGETRPPEDAGDPHHPLDQPADQGEPEPARKSTGAQGMRSHPRARGERVASEPVPDPDES